MTVADLHCHYPMHLLAEVPDLDAAHRAHKPPWWHLVERLRAWVILAAARRINDTTKDSGWRVDLDRLAEGDVRIVLSVLYLPDGELEPIEFFGAAPEQHWFDNLLDELRKVEADLGKANDVVIVRSLADFDRARRENKFAFIHAVEGGFHLGHDPDEIEPRIAELARRGVGYITLAHLFWRKVATNAPALPFLPDWLYMLILRQPRIGLSEVGEAAVDAMYKHKVLIDLSHMNRRAIKKTLERLPTDFPVVATHTGFRFGLQTYNVDKRTVRQIAERDGVIGLIMAQHQLNDGLRRKRTKTFEDTLNVLYRHIDRIHKVTGTYDNIALGTDLDGFIKPTMSGIETPADLAKLHEPLEARYPGQADKILYKNAERVLRTMFAAR
jgi:microsomal dipeptidase-like Zn-dependent dipeptidase